MFKYDHEWISISKEEYDKAYNKQCRKSDNELMNIMQEVLFNMKFRKDPIYKNPGIHNIIEENPEIAGYKYYKKGGFKLYIIGTKEQVEKEMALIDKMLVNEVRKQKNRVR